MKFTLVPFVIAMVIAVAGMPTNVFQICRRGVGTLAVDPWRLTSSASHAVRAVAQWFAALSARWRPMLAAAAALALMAADLGASHDVGVLLMATAAGGSVTEPTLAEVKTAIDASNRLFEDFKQTNDRRLAQLEARGVADPLLQQKIEKINADLEGHVKVTDAFAQLEAKVNRLSLAGGGEKSDEFTKELETFNREVRAVAQAGGRVVPAELSVESYRAYKQSLRAYLRRGDRDASYDVKAMSVGSDPDGGVTVTPDMSGRIVKKVYESSPVRLYASQQSISSDALEGLRDTDEAAQGWVGETGSRSATTSPTFAKWRIPAHEQYAMPEATQSLLDDSSINIEQWLADKVADKFGREENKAFVTGNGVGKPRGFASYTTAATADSSRAWGTIEHVASGTNGSWGTAPNGSDKLVDLVHKMNPNYFQGAIFAMNKLTLGSARQLKANSEYIWLPSMQAGVPSQLLGFPVAVFEDMASYSTTDALAVAFGNFGIGYQVVDRIGIRTLRDPYTNKPYVRFYSTKRVGGDVVHFEAIKFLKFGTS